MLIYTKQDIVFIHTYVQKEQKHNRILIQSTNSNNKTLLTHSYPFGGIRTLRNIIIIIAIIYKLSVAACSLSVICLLTIRNICL